MEGIEDREEFTFAIRFFVGDNGIGLSKASDRLIRGSSGLGMAQAIVSHFGGTLEFSDGEGSGITVTFPNTEPI
jgi:two-component sensor histidine kinase